MESATLWAAVPYVAIGSLGLFVCFCIYVWLDDWRPGRVRGKGEGAWRDYWTSPPCATCKRPPKKCAACKWHNLWPKEEYAGWRHLEDGEIRSTDHGDCFCKARYPGGEVEFLVGACRKGDTVWVVQYLKRATSLPADEVWWKLGEKVGVTPQRANRATRKCIEDIMDGYEPASGDASSKREYTCTEMSVNGADMQGASRAEYEEYIVTRDDGRTVTFPMTAGYVPTAEDKARCKEYAETKAFKSREGAGETKCECSTCEYWMKTGAGDVHSCQWPARYVPGAAAVRMRDSDTCEHWKPCEECNSWRHLREGEVLSEKNGDCGQIRGLSGKFKDALYIRNIGGLVYVAEHRRDGEEHHRGYHRPADQVWWKPIMTTPISGHAMRHEPEKMMGMSEVDRWRAGDPIQQAKAREAVDRFAAMGDAMEQALPKAAEAIAQQEDKVAFSGMTVVKAAVEEEQKRGPWRPGGATPAFELNADTDKLCAYLEGAIRQAEAWRKEDGLVFGIVRPPDIAPFHWFGLRALCRWVLRPRPFLLPHVPDKIERQTAADIRMREARVGGRETNA